MKRLIVMRHAKSSWSSEAQTDHERPLNNRGRRDSPHIASHLIQRGWIPDVVISSDAQRTRETWTLMEPLFAKHATPLVHFTRALYHAGYTSVRNAILDPEQHTDDNTNLTQHIHNAQTILLLGHNPGWEKMISTLTAQHERVTTANAALLSYDATAWDTCLIDKPNQLQPPWTFHAILRPKELK